MTKMKEILFYAICYYSGLLTLARWWMRCSGKRLIILNYHSAAGGDLRRHMLYLRRHYRVLPLEQALEDLYAPAGSAEQEKDRRTLLSLTFDDGYRDNYTQAFPLAENLQIPLTIFLIPGYIEDRDHVCCWWQAGDYLVTHTRVEEAFIEGHTYHLNLLEERKALARAIYTRARFAKSVADREMFLASVREVLAIPTMYHTEKEAIVSWEEIHEMAQSGWVTFGGHTMHHPVLAYLEDPAELRSEVSECRAIIDLHLGHPVRAFAYPIGKAEHIGEAALNAVGEAGFRWGVTTIYGINSSESDPLQLRRIEVDVQKHWLLIAADVSGIRHVCSPLFSYGNKLLMTVHMRLKALLAFHWPAEEPSTR
jgi:peptidoglycan/xylan/chitin deacetylase (PgdA/CDA1 family)